MRLIKEVLLKRFLCALLGHQWKFKMKSVEGDTIYCCKRCRRAKNGSFIMPDYFR